MTLEEFVGAVRLEDIDAELARRRYLRDPAAWVTERTHAFLWSTQRQILERVRDHRRTAVQSCHGSGKSFTAARLVAWWLTVHLPGTAFVVTTATTASQVRAILWREIGRAHASAQLPGRTNQTEWLMDVHGHEELVAFGRKPDEMDPTAFQGIHARYVLVIFDEADGIPTPLWDAAEGLLSNDDARILAIGNPVNPVSEFANVCKPGSGWQVIRISAFDTPNFTGEPVPDTIKPLLVGHVWVDEKKAKWGEDNPLYLSKVLGVFPPFGEDGLIPIAWILAAQQRELVPGLPNELGVDVGAGHDKNIVCQRRGPVARIIRANSEPDTMKTTGNIVADLRSSGARLAKVDEVGIGRGVVDRAAELGVQVLGVNVGDPAQDREQFMNLRAEGFWHLRTLFQDGHIDLDPHDDDLAAQLVSLKAKRTSRGQLQIVSKDELRRAGKPSPDRADALMLAFLPPPVPKTVFAAVMPKSKAWQEEYYRR